MNTFDNIVKKAQEANRNMTPAEKELDEAMLIAQGKKMLREATSEDLAMLK